MNVRLLHWLLIIALCCCIRSDVSAKRIRNKHYKFKITIPDRMTEVKDTLTAAQGALYYDTVGRVILLISTRESKFKTVMDYIDCKNTELENQLRRSYEDTSLKIINCSRSAYYPEITTVVHFKVSVMPSGFDTYMIYFIHNKRKDIQFSFMYKSQAEAQNMKYIDNIMKTPRLRG